MSQADETLARRRGAFKVIPAKDRRSVTITIAGERDGAGRETSKSGLSVAFSAAEFNRLTSDMILVNAGLDR